MGRFKLISIEKRGQVVLKSYESVEEVIKDIEFRDPLTFFIGDEETKRGYTFEQFIETFKKEDNKEKEQEYIDLFEVLLEELETDKSLEDQEVLINDKKYYFEEVYDNGWEDAGKYSDNYYVFRVCVFDKDGVFIEDLNMFIRQDCYRCGSYFSYYEYEYETPYLVKEKTKTVTVKKWVAL